MIRSRMPEREENKEKRPAPQEDGLETYSTPDTLFVPGVGFVPNPNKASLTLGDEEKIMNHIAGRGFSQEALEAFRQGKPIIMTFQETPFGKNIIMESWAGRGKEIQNQLQTKVNDYSELLKRTFDEHGLSHLIEKTDHVAIKMGAPEDYQKLVPLILQISNYGDFTVIDERRISVFGLKKPLNINGNECYLLEVIEPKPEKTGGYNGLEHIEIFKLNLQEVEKELQAKGIEYEMKNNKYHKVIVVKLDDTREVKFTNTRIVEVVELERKDGLIRPVTLDYF